MAQPALESFKNRALAIALRASGTPGTPVVPTAGANGVMLFNGTSGTEFDKVERPIDRPHFTNDPFAVANRRAYIEGQFELYPPTAPGQASGGDADCGVLLLPGGMTAVKDASGKTTRYNPVSKNIAIADAHWWHAGTLKKVNGCRNAISQLELAVGQRFTGQVRIQGSYEDVSEEVLPAVTLPDVNPTVARAENTQTTIAKVSGGAPLVVWGKSLSLDFGSEIKTKEYTSHLETGIDARKATFSLRIAKTSLADFNPWAVRDAGELITAKLRLTEDSGAYSELGIRGQIEQINEADIDGDYGWEISGPCIASSAGGDEFYILFGGA